MPTINRPENNFCDIQAAQIMFLVTSKVCEHKTFSDFQDTEMGDVFKYTKVFLKVDFF